MKLKLQIETLLVVVGYGRLFNHLYDTFGQKLDLNNECAVRLRIRKKKRWVTFAENEELIINENTVFCFMKPVLASGNYQLEMENSPSN